MTSGATRIREILHPIPSRVTRDLTSSKKISRPPIRPPALTRYVSESTLNHVLPQTEDIASRLLALIEPKSRSGLSCSLLLLLSPFSILS
jgi:hypothetical protein